MRVSRTVAALAAVLVLAQPVVAATSLCVEDVSTGFNWQAGQWVSSDYLPRQYIARKWSRTDDEALHCFIRMDDQGLSDTIVKGTYLDTAHGCYSLVNVGEKPGFLDFTVCEERLLSNGDMLDVNCRDARYQAFQFVPDGPFVSSRTYSVIDGMPDDQQKDSVAVSIGKCGVISP